MQSRAIARRYAKGLLDAVVEVAPGRESAVRDQLGALAEAIASHRGLRLAIVNPSISAQQKSAILGKIGETMRVDDLLIRFISVVAEKERLDYLALIAKVYGDLVDEHLGVVSAEITTATPLNPGQIAQLEASLRESTGASVRLSRRTEPELIGGVVTRIGDVIYDGSIRGHLARIRERLEAP